MGMSEFTCKYSLEKVLEGFSSNTAQQTCLDKAYKVCKVEGLAYKGK